MLLTDAAGLVLLDGTLHVMNKFSYLYIAIVLTFQVHSFGYE